MLFKMEILFYLGLMFKHIEKGAVALKFSAQPFFHIKSKSQTSKSLALIVKYIYANKQDFT